MMLRLLAGAVVVGTIFVLSPERRQPKAESTGHQPSSGGALGAIPGAAAARDALAGQVARSLLTDGIERARQALPGAEPKADTKTARVAPPKP